MPIEIERKFRVQSNSYKEEAVSTTRIVQGFLNTDPERTVRIRIDGDFGYLTVKGLSNTAGTARFEWEKEIEVKEAEILLRLCEPEILEKVRYRIPNGKHTFEVDEFLGSNEGLVVAEIELLTETESFEIPEWIGNEVTGDIKYYNSNLSKQPYNTWFNET
ncbi:MAG: CYTH domain-containing protein [Bacteroidota bacterium]